MFNADISSYEEQLLIRPFLCALRQMKFCTVKDHGHIYKFYLNHYISLTELLNMAAV
jgi:hypothetical protein